MNDHKLPVAIIGGGPVGLAAAAHLVKRNEPFILFESGKTIGANVLSWGHVKVFSPWKYNIDKVAEELLLKTGWTAPDMEEVCTGSELYHNYFLPLSNHPLIKPFIYVDAKVMAIGRKGLDKMKTHNREKQPFVIQVLKGSESMMFEARAVIDASGTWQNNNPIGSGGVFAFGELENKEKIFYGIPEVLKTHKNRYKNKNVAVVGSGHSAINSILELDQLKAEFPETQIHWILRKENIKDVFGGKENDALPARGALGMKIEQLILEDRVSVYSPFQIHELLNENNKLTLIGFQRNVKKALKGIDEIISNTGNRPDFSFLREIRVDYDSSLESVPSLAELIDPNIHSCGTVRPHGEAELRQKEKDFYIVGMKSYGRAPTFLMATGYEQVRSVVAALAGDMEAAKRVELDLPETGVCSTDSSGGSCCGAAEIESPKAKACC
ncbi:MAG: NAD(P)-binding domain-containing protein [Cytophagaceae bacterium]